jgi:hypothetical protein
LRRLSAGPEENAAAGDAAPKQSDRGRIEMLCLMPKPEPAVTENMLAAELHAAGKQLDEAQARLTELRRHDPNNAGTDGTVTLAEAKQLVADARKQYLGALRRFSHFVLSR